MRPADYCQRLLLTVCAVVIGMVTSMGSGRAANAAYPEKAVRIIVAYAPGGATDVEARKIAQKLTEQMGQTFFVENKVGASGIIGTQQVARAPADGYTLLAMENSYSMLPYIFKSVPWNYETAFAPITVIAFAPVLVCVRTQSQFKDLKALLAFARANPGKLAYGSGGMGSALHFSTEAFQQAADIKLAHVPYKGAADAMTAMLAGEVDVTLVSTPTANAQLQGGRIRGLAITGTSRFPSFPSIPTFAEAGLANFGIANWTGLVAPAGVPANVAEKLYQEVTKALRSSDIRAFLSELGAEPGGITPDAFAGLIKEESRRWQTVAAKADIERQ